jgi:large subunit ribosomal protein L10
VPLQTEGGAVKREDKQKIVSLWHERFGRAQAVLLTAFQGLNAAQMADLRGRCHAGGIDYVVLKNTLAKLALKETQFEKIGAELKGPLGWAVGYKDEVEAAKIVAKYAKDNDKFKVLGGGIVGQSLNATEVENLSKLPGKNEMRAMFLGLLVAVPTKFVRTLNEVPAGFVRVVDARRAAVETK